jgi:hypothetical protein
MFEIDDGYNIPTKSGFIIRPVTREQLDELQKIVADFPLERRAEAYYTLAKRSLVMGRIGEADEDAVHEILTAYDRKTQTADEQNLRDGVKLAIMYPHLANVSCDQCRKYSYSPFTGKTTMDPDSLQPLLRDTKNEPLACVVHERWLCGGSLPVGVAPPACPKGHWQDEKELSERNVKAYQHWKNAMAYGNAPNDQTFLRNAAIIEKAGAVASRDKEMANFFLRLRKFKPMAVVNNG